MVGVRAGPVCFSGSGGTKQGIPHDGWGRGAATVNGLRQRVWCASPCISADAPSCFLLRKKNEVTNGVFKGIN